MVPRPRHGLSLCAGGAGLDMGLGLAEPGFHTRCYVEWQDYPRSVLIAAQRAGYLAPAPIWDDVTTFDGGPMRGAIDTILAGYPCQPFSQAGQRKGADDERHLWPDIARIIDEIRPRWVLLENVDGHVSLGAETVLRHLRRMGFTAAAGLFTAAETGTPHKRQRWFCVAYADRPDPSPEWQQCGRELGWPESHRDESERERTLGNPESVGQHQGQPEPEFRRRRDTSAGTSGDVGDADEGHDQGKLDRRGYSETTSGSESQNERGQTQERERVRTESGGTGNTLDHPTSARHQKARLGPKAKRESGQRLPGDGRRELAGELADTQGPDRRRQQQEAATGCGRSGPAREGRDLANTDETGPQGQQPDKCNAQRREKPTGLARLCCGTGIHPPGPSNANAWADIFANHPDLAPAISKQSVAHASQTFAARLYALNAQGNETNTAGELAAQTLDQSPEYLVGYAQAQSTVRRMVDGLALRSRALTLLGNGVHPLAAANAWRSLSLAHGLCPLDLDPENGGTE